MSIRKALKETPPKARFWENINGSWVTLTLAPGQTIQHHRFAITDEGWRTTERIYEYNGENCIVSACMVRDGRDCDGRLKYVWEGYFDLLKGEREPCFIGWDRKGKEVYSTDMKRPVWIQSHERQRDFTAEAAGS